MSEEQDDKLRRMPMELVRNVPLDSCVRTAPKKAAVPLSKREGVYIHSFVCNDCGLHFNVYSWQADRHRTRSVWCPECGQNKGRFRHYRTQVSESPKMLLDHPGEIFRHCPPPGFGVMNDTTDRGLVNKSD